MKKVITHTDSYLHNSNSRAHNLKGLINVANRPVKIYKSTRTFKNLCRTNHFYASKRINMIKKHFRFIQHSILSCLPENNA